jgi:uncharacterized protein
MYKHPTNETIAARLREAKNIAVVGLSDNPTRTSYMIAEAMQQAGYRIFPVNPRLTAPVLGEQPVATLADISEPIDIINVFRRSEHVLPIAEEAVQIGAKALWLQLGVLNEQAAALAAEHEMFFVMDRCIKVEHALLR